MGNESVEAQIDILRDKIKAARTETQKIAYLYCVTPLPPLEQLAISTNFEHCEGTIEVWVARLRQHVTALRRDELFTVALDICDADSRIPFPPEQDNKPGANLAALLEWCVLAKRSLQGEPVAKATSAVKMDLPPLDRNGGLWVTNKIAAGLEGVDTETLGSYRQRGQTADNDMAGVDKDGRIWRRQGTPNAHPWYLRASLKTIEKSQQNPG